MPDVYNPAPNQPLIVFFELNIGSLQKIYVGPEIPVAFKFVIEEVPEVHFTLLDVTGYEVEPALHQSRNPDTGIATGTFRFGYLNGGKQSKEWTFEVQNVMPKFIGDHFEIDVIGTICLTPMVSTNQLSGTLREILERVSEIHGMELKILPEFGTEYMMDVGYNDSKSTAMREMVHHKLADETDMAYVERILEFARDGEGKGGYRYFIISGKDGRPMLAITKAKNAGPNYEYRVQDKESVVLKWEPEISYSGAVLGANDMHINSYQRITGDEHKVVCQQQNTGEFQEKFGEVNSASIKSVPTKEKADKIIYTSGSENMPESVTGSAIRARAGSSCSSYAGINPALNDHLWEWMDSQSAVLTILGDPEIVPIQDDGNMTLVDVTCYLPIGPKNKSDLRQKHYTSGLYQCDRVEHLIAPGMFETVLYLSRACGGVPEAGEEE